MHISYRKPKAVDGGAVHQLINRCPPLDKNSLYCNLLQCTDFASTSIVAERTQGEGANSGIKGANSGIKGANSGIKGPNSGIIIGFISGYIPPDNPDTLFVWQVALDQQSRGRGIALQMLKQLFDRHKHLKRLQTTIAPDNIPSQRLFQRFFEHQRMTVVTSNHFRRGIHLDENHEDEILYLGTKPCPSKAITPQSNSEPPCHLSEAIG